MVRTTHRGELGGLAILMSHARAAVLRRRPLLYGAGAGDTPAPGGVRRRRYPPAGRPLVPTSGHPAEYRDAGPALSTQAGHPVGTKREAQRQEAQEGGRAGSGTDTG